MNINNRKGSAMIIGVFLIAILLIVSGIWYYGFYKKSTAVPMAGSSQNVVVSNVAKGLGGAGPIVLPSQNDFEITSPAQGAEWDKQDSNKVIGWVYPSELKGQMVIVHAKLINTDLMNATSSYPPVSVDIFDGSMSVPDSGVGQIPWDAIKAAPESAFYGYSGNSRVVIFISADNLKTYEAMSDMFAVSSVVVASKKPSPMEIILPQDGANLKIGSVLNIKWTGGYNSAVDTCEIKLVGPFDSNGQVIQAMGGIITLGAPSCADGNFSWQASSTYLVSGYPWKLIISTPYDFSDYYKTINIVSK